MPRWVLGAGAVVLAFAVGFWGSSSLPDDARGFELTRTDGTRINSQDVLAGEPYVIFFGYTFCPDVCPTTLAYLSSVLDQQESATGQRAQAVFVSVDPQRDTPERLAQYVNYFDERIWAVTGTQAELEQTAKTFSVFFQKVPGKGDDDYLVDHSAGILVMDDKHRLSGVIRDGEALDQALATLANAY